MPLGATGLVQQSYHIKITVRDDDKFWLSSGNWKTSSSQPVVDQAERDKATEEDLPGNREWHVIVTSPTLAERFRSHIIQDMKRSHDLGGKEVPVAAKDRDPLVEVPETLLELLEAPKERLRWLTSAAIRQRGTIPSSDALAVSALRRLGD